MTNQEQLITPPQLVEQWVNMLSSRSDYAVFSLAAQWGWDQHRAATESELQQAADQELEACCEVLRGEFNYSYLADPLRATRRPKPPSLKERALEALDRMDQLPTAESLALIREALEALPND